MLAKAVVALTLELRHLGASIKELLLTYLLGDSLWAALNDIEISSHLPDRGLD